MGCGCAPDPVFRPDPQSFLATVSACGNWCYRCADGPKSKKPYGHVIWENRLDEVVSGTVTVNYQGGCGYKLKVIVSHSCGYCDYFYIEKPIDCCEQLMTGNTVSKSYSDITKVEIMCDYGCQDDYCFGKYCLDLHYVLTPE